ncbi:MAG TPA: glycosyltransferase family 4 protein [Candidatus Woesebacteria bacterium]|nr:glycosyltransferase family 4 protein [Candidatus Woesebacteria bacterium]
MVTITKPTIVHLTPFFHPNIGGVETHLLDLTSELSLLKYQNIVLTYSPLTTNVIFKNFEKINKYLTIYRYPWIGKNLFNYFEKHPLINFLYLTPYLFLRTLIWFLKNPKPDIIHSHGINAAFIGFFIQKIFNIKTHIVSIYSTYDNVPLNNIYFKIIAYLLNNTNQVLTQSNKSISQLINLGINKSKISRYRHWVDLNRFKPMDKKNIRQQLSLPNRITILFIGRLIPPKNVISLAKICHYFPNCNFIFIGEGPDYKKLKQISLSNPNMYILGNVPYSKLHFYYNSADIFCFPSKYDEGWGRVIMESIACGTPVIASNLGAIPEVIDNSVSLLLTPSSKNIKNTLSSILSNKKHLKKITLNCRNYANQNFSKKNIDLITRFYVKT